MKIALLSWSLSNDFATAIVLKLIQNGHKVSTLVVRKRDSFIKRIMLNAGKYGTSGAFKKGIKKLTSQDRVYTGQADRHYLKEYIGDLGNSPDITLERVMERNGISFIYVDNICENRSIMHLRSESPDIIIFAGGGLVRKNLLEIPKIGVLNAHMGFLPEFKGMNVLEWSLHNNATIGVTIHFIDEEIDTGDILIKREIPIVKGDTINSLRDKSYVISVNALAETVDKLQEQGIKAIKQENTGKQYFVMHSRLKDIVETNLQKKNSSLNTS